ncbi:hypothetical protein ACQKDY_09700 [Alteromonas macleodii]|uniref:hypothetical protein n=1 Tax=Alteromonas macleodii TaxID=28108 RepID=UPI003CFEE9B6
MMLVPNTLKAKPSENYDGLIKQFFALKKLCESKIKQCSNYSKKLAEYDRESLIAGNEALESEREMNAQLTEELEAANERVKELEGQLQLTMLTTHEAAFESDYGKKRLYNFSIKEKLEVLNEFKKECGIILPAHKLQDKIEQLRKEQEHV